MTRFSRDIRDNVCVSPAAIRTHSPGKPVLVFVSSRRQTRLTALDLIAYLAAEDNPKQWLHMEELEVRTDSVALHGGTRGKDRLSGSTWRNLR